MEKDNKDNQEATFTQFLLSSLNLNLERLIKLLLIHIILSVLLMGLLIYVVHSDLEYFEETQVHVITEDGEGVAIYQDGENNKIDLEKGKKNG